MRQDFIHEISRTVCLDCAYCTVHNNIMDCELEKFSPISVKQGRLNTPIMMDCLEYEPRPK